MLPWFIYILLQLGWLRTAEEWFTLSSAQQQQYEIIIVDENIGHSGG